MFLMSINDVNSNMKIIDIRSRNEYKNGHILNAINIDSYELMINPSKYLNKNDTYYLYCSFGNRSKRLCTFLNNSGYHTVNLEGGYHNYLSS